MEDLEKSVRIKEISASGIASSPFNLAIPLEDLRYALSRLLLRTELIDALKKAACIKRATTEAKDFPPALAARVDDVQGRLERLLSETTSMDELVETLRIERAAIDNNSGYPSDRAETLDELRDLLGKLLERTAEMYNQEKTVLFKHSTATGAVDHPLDTENLQDTINNFVKRAEAIYDLEKTICDGPTATTASDHPYYQLGQISDLEREMNLLILRTEPIENLNELIRFERTAIDAEDYSPVLLGHLNDLEKYLYELFRRTESASDLEDFKRIQKERQCRTMGELEYTMFMEHSAALTSKDLLDRALHLNSLGNKLYEFFLRTKSMSDLEEAISIGQAAVDTLPKNNTDRVGYVSDLGVRFHSRFHRTAAIDDLEKSLQIEQYALQNISEGHPGRAAHLHILGNVFRDLFIKNGTMDDIGKAIENGQAAVKAAENLQDSSAQGRYLSDLGASFMVRYENLQSADDLDNAILNAQRAVNMTDEDDPAIAQRLNGLGLKLLERNRKTGSMDDLEAATNHFINGLYEAGSPFFDCLKSGMNAVDIVSADGAYEDAAHYLQECLDLLPDTVLQNHSHEDLQYILRQLSGLGSIAASIFLRAGKSALESLQALEKSRGIISSFIIDSRFDVSMLGKNFPDLWSKYCYLREMIAIGSISRPRAGSVAVPEWLLPMPEAGYYTSSTLASNLMIKELDALVHIIRGKPEFSRFQLPPTSTEFYELAQPGPIVSFNVTKFGSHAFLITKKGVRVLPLPKLILSDVDKHVLRNLGDNLSRRDAKLVSIDGVSKAENSSHAESQAESMFWIWDVAVRPVLEVLGLVWRDEPPRKLPSVWWVGGGLIGLLPLHAAGHHSKGSTDNTMSHVVSSYAPSIKALQFSRKKAWVPPTTGDTKILIISMDKTPGHADLNVEGEVSAIQRHIGPSASVEILETPTAEDVLQKVTACSLVHFACHGAANVEQPSKSALLLGTKIVENLKVEDLQSVNHQLAQVAYLSACSTAEVGAQSLIDENVSLATSFQLVGFRHVVATLWGAFDSAAVAVAARFYEHLLKQGVDSAPSIAYALHQAVLDLKAVGDNSENISFWAPFIHMGP